MYKVLGADQKEYGPVSAEQVQQWIRDRRLNSQSLLMLEGTVDGNRSPFFLNSPRFWPNLE